MFNFDRPRYEKVLSDAIALRDKIESAVDKICKEGYSNIYFIGCGGTYAHSLPMKYWIDHSSEKIKCESVIPFVYFRQEVEIQKRLLLRLSIVKKQEQEQLSMFQMIIHRYVIMQTINCLALQRMIVFARQFTPI